MKWLIATMAVFALTASGRRCFRHVESIGGNAERHDGNHSRLVNDGKVTAATMGRWANRRSPKARWIHTVSFAVVQQGPNGEFRINYKGGWAMK